MWFACPLRPPDFQLDQPRLPAPRRMRPATRRPAASRSRSPSATNARSRTDTGRIIPIHPDVWPLDSVTLGGQSYTKAELLITLSTSTTKDASLILARQLIAAILNTANGSDPRPVCDAITQSNTLLSGFSGKLQYNV